MVPNQTKAPTSGALLIHKHAGISSFGVVEALQKLWMEKYQVKKRDIPKLGHGGTLDPFATGLLIVCVGPAVKLARYFLNSSKCYEGIIRFGETTIPGDPTEAISETSTEVPQSLEQIQTLATTLTLQPYLQTPPMHSAKKKDGKPLYELARQGIEVDREPKVCHLYSFDILNYEKPRASFRVNCSSGTYIRTLAKDLAKMAGSVALLDKLERTGSGTFQLSQAWTLAQISEATRGGKIWDELDCWVPFDRVLNGYPRAEATEDEARALQQGQQYVLITILKRGVESLPINLTVKEEPGQNEFGDEYDEHVTIYCKDKLIAVARRTQAEWSLERVFCE